MNDRNRTRLSFLANAIYNQPNDYLRLVKHVRDHGVDDELDKALSAFSEVVKENLLTSNARTRKKLVKVAEELIETGNTSERQVGQALTSAIDDFVVNVRGK